MTGKDITSAADSPVEDPERGSFTARYDWTANDDPSISIVRTVAAVTGTEPTEMRPLYEVVDPEAMNRLLTRAGARTRPIRLSFRFENCAVTVHADGRVIVAPCE
ncbi:HalOD1 output domain-containing protein [Natrinema sp. DC36]|uniref:HalOD1 output domain-containing protein n=1 Tax=Natrinema sp. DC36 TaxID=2878680 RepID=UPI001CF096EE|nr:HalOD1 output domain-containing protein [Natrinema sp. DC36]